MTTTIVLCTILATTLYSSSVGKFWDLHGWYPSSVSSLDTPGSDRFASCDHTELDKTSAAAFYSILDAYDVRRHFFSQSTNAIERKDAVQYIGNYDAMKKVFNGMRAIPSFQTKDYRSFVGSSLLDFVAKEVDGDISYKFHDWTDLPCGGDVNWNSFPCLYDLPENDGSLYVTAGHAGNLTAMLINPIYVTYDSEIRVPPEGNGITPTFEKVIDMAYSHTQLGEMYDPNRPIRWAPLENAAQVVGMQDKIMQVFLREDVACVTNRVSAICRLEYKYGGTCACAQLLPDGTVEIIPGYETYNLPAVYQQKTVESTVTNIPCSLESSRIRVRRVDIGSGIDAACNIGVSSLDEEDFDSKIVRQMNAQGADIEDEVEILQSVGRGASTIVWKQGSKGGVFSADVIETITADPGPLEMEIAGILYARYGYDEAVECESYSRAFGDRPYRPNVSGVSMQSVACEFSSLVARQGHDDFDPSEEYNGFYEDIYIGFEEFDDDYDYAKYESDKSEGASALQNLYNTSNGSIASEIIRCKSNLGIGNYRDPNEYTNIEPLDMSAIIETTAALSCGVTYTSSSHEDYGGVNTCKVVRVASEEEVEWVSVEGTLDRGWTISAVVSPSAYIPSAVSEKAPKGFALDTRRTFISDSKVVFPSLDVLVGATSNTLCISHTENVEKGEMLGKFSEWKNIDCVSGDDPVYDVGVSGFERAFARMPNLLKASFSMCTNCDDRAFYRAFFGCTHFHKANFTALRRAGDDAFRYAFVGCGRASVMDCDFSNLKVCGDGTFQGAFPQTRSEFVSFPALEECGDQAFDSAYRDASFFKDNAYAYFNGLRECGDWAFASAFEESAGRSVTLVRSFLNEEGNAYTNKFAVAGYLDGCDEDEFKVAFGQFVTNCTVTTGSRTKRGISFVAVCTLASEGDDDLNTLFGQGRKAYFYSSSRPSKWYEAPQLSGFEVIVTPEVAVRKHPVYDEYSVVTNLNIQWSCETLPEEFDMCDANIGVSVIGQGHAIDLSSANPLSTETNITGTVVGEVKFSAFGTNTADIVVRNVPIPFGYRSGTAWKRNNPGSASFSCMVSWWTPFGYRKYTW